MFIIDGIIVPILIYAALNGSGHFTNIPGQSLKWRGIKSYRHLYYVTTLLMCLGGYVPRDSPIPEVQSNSKFEVIITIIATSFGMLSTLYFSLFNIYYRNHQ